MSTSSSAAHGPRALSTPLGRRVTAGVAGGLAGGIVFGMLMTMMGMMGMIASMVGSQSPWVGWGVHLVISIAYGLVLTLFFAGRFLTSYGRATVTGLVYGVVLWIIGPLLIMPMMLGMPLLAFNLTVMLSLMGHMIYGVLLAVVAVRILKVRA
ncbi:hypothetical protein [Arthrobacter bambusae]|uniref:hypothetical protein n=1 Tax=Arthrobacter bambusae TaxID=1338426 RepID=UPI00278945BA|nr:hypothetical protein [Arthrobacter bambusae]MDQ0213106.1 putative membrane protein YagU involved in acid resistance [Arthrobacter bambusae]MDQ0237444.1 putative membrane protein YagU involved in acid resistance [Arthrobacter bambusae]